MISLCNMCNGLWEFKCAVYARLVLAQKKKTTSLYCNNHPVSMNESEHTTFINCCQSQAQSGYKQKMS